MLKNGVSTSRSSYLQKNQQNQNLKTERNLTELEDQYNYFSSRKIIKKKNNSCSSLMTKPLFEKYEENNNGNLNIHH